MREPGPVLVQDLFPAMLEELLSLLENLTPDEWNAPTVCVPWTVKDLAFHLLADELGKLSGGRDRYSGTYAKIDNWQELVDFINAQNEAWVTATRRFSPRVLCELLRMAGTQVNEYFRSANLYDYGMPVSWAGPEPAPVWLDIAREFTERWHHQQQIRDAVGKDSLATPKFLSPVLATFVWALPYTYRDVKSPEGTLLELVITGEAGGHWFLKRENEGWKLYQEVEGNPDAQVFIPQDVAWRLFTKGISREQAGPRTSIMGDQELGAKTLEMVSIIA